MNSKSNEPLHNQTLQKSNDFVAAKYNSTIIENKVMSIALARLEMYEEKDGSQNLIARMYPGELKQLFGNPTNIYKELKKVSKTIVGHNMFIEDGKGNFKSFAIVPNATYENGVFEIKFNEEIKDHIYGLAEKGHYTTYELSVLSSFSKNSSFRLYEVLKKDLYKCNRDNKETVELEYNLSELKFMIGVANSDDAHVKNAMARMGNNIDWDSLYNMLDKKDRKYERWDRFADSILKPAQTEMLEKSDLQFEFEGIRLGRSIKNVRFWIKKNVPQNADTILEKQKILEEGKKNTIRLYSDTVEYEQTKLPRAAYQDLYDKYIDHNGLTEEDIDVLIHKASYKKEMVEEAIEYADSQEYIENYMGWLVRYIERGGYNKVDVISGSAERATYVREVMEKANSNPEDSAKRIWAKQQESEIFSEFIVAIEEYTGLSYDIFDVTYEVTEKVQAYADWKMGRAFQF